MTAIIYEIKHNSAHRTNGTALCHLSLSLALSFLLESYDSEVYSTPLMQLINILEILLNTPFSLLHHPNQLETCKLCNLRVICAQGSEGSLAKLFDPRCFPRHGVRNAGVRTVCLRSGALACSQQLLQMVCSLCHPLSRHCL